MPRTPDALIKPELLIWARKSAGYGLEDAAKKLRVDKERLGAWEAGDARPTIAQLRAAAKLYRRPLAIFYLPEPPRDYQPLRDYRRLPDADLGKLSPELLATIRRAHAVREAALELRELDDEDVASPPTVDSRLRDPERLGEAARRLLGVTLEQQSIWGDPGRALSAWIDAVVRLDLLVLQAQSISIQEMRGFSVWMDPLPVIVLNGADFPRGRIFTLLHELAHLLLHTDGVCDAAPRRRELRPSDAVEILCNRAAAAALMPSQALTAEIGSRKPTPDGKWPDATLRSLSETFGVSQEAVVRRLYSLDLTTWGFLREKQAEYQAAYEAFRAEQTRQRREEERAGGPSYYRMKVRDLGRPFIESALDAYNRRAITGSDLTEFLEIKINQLPKLEEELATTGQSRE